MHPEDATMAAAGLDGTVLDVTGDAARLLYPNPVCLLGSANEVGVPNLMTISWLTCVDNDGTVFFSMNERRTSAENLLSSRRVCLSVAVDGMQSLLVAVGGCHGPSDQGIPKPESLGVELCAPGWAAPWEADAGPPAAECAGAHLDLAVESMTTAGGHHRVMARVTGAWVRSWLWSGRTYALPPSSSEASPGGSLLGPPSADEPGRAPLAVLTFLGSRRFGRVVEADKAAKPASDRRW